MCMKYVNATITPYASFLPTPKGDVLSLHAPLIKVRCEAVNGDKAPLEDFIVVTDFNFIGTASKEHKTENPLERGDKIHFIIRLTKCATNLSDRKYVDLDNFVIDLKEAKDKGLTSRACFDYYNYTRVTEIPKDKRWIPVLNGKPLLGNYVLKVVIKDDNTGKETVQSMAPLEIKMKDDAISVFDEPDACQTD